MIQVTFPNGINSVTVQGLTQWDYGQTLSFSGITLVDGTQVHFANSAVEKAIVKTITNGIVEVPDELLENPLNITAWIYEVGTSEGETIKTISLPVVKRTEPDDFISGMEYKALATLIKNATSMRDTWRNATNLPKYIELDTNAEMKESFWGSSGVETLIINAPNTIDGTYLVRLISTLKFVKLKLSDNCTSFSSITNGCSNLEKVIIDSSTANVTVFNNAFAGCIKLVTIEGALDFTSATSASGIFPSAVLEDVEFVEETINVTLSVFSPYLTSQSLASLIHGLKNRTGQTQLTLTIGTANINKLTTDLITEVANKNWILN